VRKAYILIFSDGTGGLETVKAWANSEPAVLHWRHDMPHSFYLISEQDASKLSTSFINFNGKKGRFLIIEAGDNRQGLLPNETWYLLRNKQQKPKNG
jgi:hypothetical protein